MIFSATNEDGKSNWESVMDETKTVTRRKNPQPVGSIRAVQKNRCGKAISFVKILSCEDEQEWMNKELKNIGEIQLHEGEAKKEGFNSWGGLQRALRKANPKNKPLYRIEFIKVYDVDVKV